MTKSQEIFNQMNEDELKLMLLCFSKPQVMEAMRIYHVMPAHSRPAFYEAGKKAMQEKGFFIKSIRAHNQILDLVEG